MSENKITLGKTLKDARIAKGFTLDDLQQATKIQKRYLIAIEDQQFDELPGDFYVRAFIKQYADMVDLDGAELLKQFDSALPSTQTQEYVDKVNETNPETRSQQRKVDERSLQLRRLIPLTGIVVVVLAVLIGIWVAAAHSSRSTVKQNVDSSSSSSSQSASKKSSSKKASSKTASFKQLSTTSSGSTWEMKNASSKPKVTLSATSSAWVAVTIGGTTTWQGTLSSSTSHSLTVPSGTTSMTFKFGNAPATAVKIDGKKFNFNSTTATSSASSSSSTTDTTGTSSSSTTTSTQVQDVTLEFK
ncbi:helix-turn-helix domain-containing protein [Levilactobacillus spicheri]|uniref:Transcriptional regulator n=1 Tax=Levilactobacillus spicheri TaxID=216463 RepID=A0A0F3RQS3_9LACO|nr:RodZ domain-containing protein [Levilactobacillus spicheri]KJW11939.1 transcriptional regulator [Levilactobacillus spicheri]